MKGVISTRLVCLLVLALGAGAVHGQVIDWLEPGGGIWSEEIAWAGENIPDQPTESALLPDFSAAYTVVVDGSYSIQSLEAHLGATVELASGVTLTLPPTDLGEGLLIDGEVIVGSIPASPTQIHFLQGGRIDTVDMGLPGSGVLTLDSTAARSILSAAPGTRVIGSTTIRGTGVLRFDELVIQSFELRGGLIRAEPVSTSSGTLLIDGGYIENAGQLRAEADATLRIQNATIENSPSGDFDGRIIADGGLIDFRGDSTIIGGMLEAVNGGNLEVIGQDATLTLHDSGMTTGRVAAGGHLFLGGDFTSGTIAVLGPWPFPGQITFLDSGAVNQSRIEMDSSTNISMARLHIDSGATRTLMPGAEIIGNGQVFVNGVLENRSVVTSYDWATGSQYTLQILGSGTLRNRGTLLAEPATAMTFDGVSIEQLDGGTVEAHGEVRISDCAVIGGELNAHGADGGSISFGGQSNALQDIERISGPVTVGLGHHAWVDCSGPLPLAGLLRLRGVGPFTSELRFLDSGTIGGQGEAEIQFDSSPGAGYAHMKVAQGEVRTVLADVRVSGGGLMSGEWQFGGVFTPGPDVSGIYGSAALTLTPDAVYECDVGADGADVIQCGTGMLDGSLEVRFLDGFEPQLGQTFDIVVCSTDLSGNFAEVSVPELPDGMHYTLKHEGETLRLGFWCFPDWNGDGNEDTLDMLSFLNDWIAGDPKADINGDGSVNTLDFILFLNQWTGGC